MDKDSLNRKYRGMSFLKLLDFAPEDIAYFLDFSSLAPNLFTFNFDRILDGAAGVVDNRVFDTICSILERFFQEQLRQDRYPKWRRPLLCQYQDL